jgi:hypothetical protein
MQAGINNRKREQRSEKKRNTKREREFFFSSLGFITRKKGKKEK